MFKVIIKLASFPLYLLTANSIKEHVSNIFYRFVEEMKYAKINNGKICSLKKDILVEFTSCGKLLILIVVSIIMPLCMSIYGIKFF